MATIIIADEKLEDLRGVKLTDAQLAVLRKFAFNPRHTFNEEEQARAILREVFPR